MTSGPPSILPPSDHTRDESEPPTERQHYAPTFRGTSVIDTSGARPFADAPTSRHADVNTTLDPGNSTAQFGGDADLPPPTYPTIGVQFHSNTIAPSPPLTQSPTNASTPRFEPPAGEQSAHQPSPLGAGVSLRIATDGIQVLPVSRTDSLGSSGNLTATRTPQRKTSQAALQPVSRTPSLKTALGYGFGTASAASSTVSSPIISALGDVTPLPSPLLMSDSPGPWRKLVRPPSRDAPTHLSPTPESCLVTSNGESVASALANNSKRKAYAGLAAGAKEGEAHGGAVEGPPTHARNRSISDYVPDGNNQIPKRMLTVSGPHGKPTITTEQLDGSFEGHMRREPHLSEARGLTPVEKPPTPPPSESSSSYSDAASAEGSKRQHEYFEARGREDNKMRRWRAIKLLGQGTFSRVMLATSLAAADAEAAAQSSGLLTPEPLSRYDRRSLVAVKVCEHGPKGGASEDRVEMSLKRELEIMQSIRHPSLVHLKAWNIELTRAILVLSYCPGGDLFDVASGHRELLTPPLLRRIFTELVGAVSYLHERRIVHRDIKLENVLVNLPPTELADASIDWATYPYSVATLTDLGLSRRVADDEKLETRCGSDDYAAPEVIMGQPYDGRAIDAWSMGVLLYALLEGRLPFDPHPGMSDAHRMRSRTSHRIARVEWRWLEYAGEDGDHEGDTEKFQKQGLLGAMQITEGLLKRARSRWTVEKLLCHEWIKEGIRLEGGVQFREEQEAEEVS